MKKPPASPEALRVAREAFDAPDASPAQLQYKALNRLGLRRFSDYPFARTHLLLTAAKMKPAWAGG